ncbi:hypothetical protein [Geminisphaera colitermitum]|uniref:hypothetical protein n=1 Tax=Geminisphaera colitermitum TaxID=1148786 RepID=UPI000158CA72|nr:hypothetical protein [Geminisphaera colitermitum]
MKNDEKNAETPPPARKEKGELRIQFSKPVPALWIRYQHPVFGQDELRVTVCEVVSIRGDIATVCMRELDQHKVASVSVRELCSSTEKGLRRLAGHISDLLARPPSVTLAGKETSGSETPSFLTRSLSGSEHVNAERIG